MNLTWYLNRLRKMSFEEVLKRFREHLYIYHTQIKYRNPTEWPYSRFARNGSALVFHTVPSPSSDTDWEHYRIFKYEFDLTKPIDWYFTENKNVRWPNYHYAKIKYRPGNPYGDVRINWELNRLQFLPVMAVMNEDLAKTIITDWLDKNAYLHGPSYLSTMEAALRWVSIYWAVCLFKKPMDKFFIKRLTGLAIASGELIESRPSTHSSAGNHFIVEAVGLFWIAKACQNQENSSKWMTKARKILWEQTNRQLNPDGTNMEQSFWYLGLVLDALFHYFLLEDIEVIPKQVLERVEQAIEFVNEVTLPDGSFPDYGDRDDSFVFRANGVYNESPFPGLLNKAAFFFNRSDWYRDCFNATKHLEFWTASAQKYSNINEATNNRLVFSDKPRLKTYSQGGMTLMKWGKGRLLFRHAPLGSGDTCGHGHADALSVLFSWNNIPVLIDLGSGQYNGSRAIRDFFRSTIAHNTVEIGGGNQARILGPFLWQKSYETYLTQTETTPSLLAEAYHTGYKETFGIIHKRKVEWLEPYRVEVHDDFSGSGGVKCRGAFHLGNCRAVVNKKNQIEAEFGDFIFSIAFPPEFTVEVFHGSDHPFMGWRSTIYGMWEPIYSIIFSFELSHNHDYKTILKIVED